MACSGARLTVWVNKYTKKACHWPFTLHTHVACAKSSVYIYILRWFLFSKGCFFPQLLTYLTTCWGKGLVLLVNDGTQERPLVRTGHSEMTFYSWVYQPWKPEQTDRAPVFLHLEEHNCTQKVSQREAGNILWLSSGCRNITFWTNLSKSKWEYVGFYNMMGMVG